MDRVSPGDLTQLATDVGPVPMNVGAGPDGVLRRGGCEGRRRCGGERAEDDGQDGG